jgi:hypothetical protein
MNGLKKEFEGWGEYVCEDESRRCIVNHLPRIPPSWSVSAIDF